LYHEELFFLSYKKKDSGAAAIAFFLFSLTLLIVPLTSFPNHAGNGNDGIPPVNKKNAALFALLFRCIDKAGRKE
jgi:hypothetical protein